MRQVPSALDPDLDQVVGYVLKQAATVLRTRMEDVLRPLGLTVPQYVCLELLARRPGASNAELARGAFVTRQSMNGVLRGLQDRGLLVRPDDAPHGRARPSELTTEGVERLHEASTVVSGVEQQMLGGLDDDARRGLRDQLVSCLEALTAAPGRRTLDGP